MSAGCSHTENTCFVHPSLSLKSVGHSVSERLRPYWNQSWTVVLYPWTTFVTRRMSKDDTGLLKKRSEYSSRIKGALLLFSPASTRECARGHGEMSSSDSESTEKNASPVGHLADQAGGCCGLTLWSSWVPMITFFAEFSFSPLYLVPLLYVSL